MDRRALRLRYQILTTGAWMKKIDLAELQRMNDEASAPAARQQ
jgi:hypothetical protein